MAYEYDGMLMHLMPCFRSWNMKYDLHSMICTYCRYMGKKKLKQKNVNCFLYIPNGCQMVLSALPNSAGDTSGFGERWNHQWWKWKCAFCHSAGSDSGCFRVVEGALKSRGFGNVAPGGVHSSAQQVKDLFFGVLWGFSTAWPHG